MGLYRFSGAQDRPGGQYFGQVRDLNVDHFRSQMLQSPVGSVDVEREEPLGPEPPEVGQRWADALGLLAEQALAAGFGTTGPSDESEENGPAGPRREAGPDRDQDSESDRDGEPSACTCGGRPAPLLGTRAERYQVFLYLDPEALAREGNPAHTHLEDGTRLTADTARRLTCDGAIVPVVTGAGGTGDSIASRAPSRNARSAGESATSQG